MDIDLNKRDKNEFVDGCPEKSLVMCAIILANIRLNGFSASADAFALTLTGFRMLMASLGACNIVKQIIVYSF